MTPTLRLVGPSFANFPVCTDLDKLDADVAIVGMPIVTPYVRALPCTSAAAPGTIRRQSLRCARLTHYDFDFGGPLFQGRDVRCVDVGDIVRGAESFEDYGKMATTVIRKIVERGVIPITLGGDHATPVPVFRAYKGFDPICIVHVDAHLDWRDEREGLKDGLSSPLRRASEQPWITSMIQIGLRGQGSARQEEVDAARAWGSILVGAAELHKKGMEAVVRRIPKAKNYYITIDADGLDPSIAPGVTGLIPGGVTYYQMLDLMRGVAKKGRVIGGDFVEVMPERDVADQTSLYGARILLNLIGCLVESGQLGNGRAGAKPAKAAKNKKKGNKAAA